MTEYIAQEVQKVLKTLRSRRLSESTLQACNHRLQKLAYLDEAQKHPALTRSETARLERCLLEQASNSLSRMTIHYCDYVETYMDAAPPSEERLEAVQRGIRTLNHISVTLERLRRALQETAPAEAKD